MLGSFKIYLWNRKQQLANRPLELQIK